MGGGFGSVSRPWLPAPWKRLATRGPVGRRGRVGEGSDAATSENGSNVHHNVDTQHTLKYMHMFGTTGCNCRTFTKNSRRWKGQARMCTHTQHCINSQVSRGGVGCRSSWVPWPRQATSANDVQGGLTPPLHRAAEVVRHGSWQGVHDTIPSNLVIYKGAVHHMGTQDLNEFKR